MLLNVENVANIALYGGILGTVIFAIKTLAPVDLDTEVEADFTSYADSDASFHLFSIGGISAFFMTAGWMGYLALKWFNYGLKIGALIALVSGVVAMFAYAWVFASMRKLEHIPQVSLDELVGKVGKAYLSFAPKGVSKIQIEFGGRLETLEAKNNSDIEIKAFEGIKVVKVENEQVYIEKE